MSELAKEIAEYADSLSYEDLPDEVVHEAKRRFIDSFACALGAHEAPPVLIAKKVLRPDSAQHAAFLYGTMIRYIDFNDAYLAETRELGHPSDNLGGVLGAAKFSEAGGRDVIEASVLAYELQCRLGDAASLREGGWDHVVWGLVSSSAAAGKLMGLGPEGIRHTIGLSLSSDISTRQVREGAKLSMWKASAFANACRNTLFYTRLVKNGMSGPYEIFEGKHGVFNQLTGEFDMDVSEFGDPFKITDCWIKKWPAEMHAQSAVEAALELHEEVDTDEIEEILIETHEAGKSIIGTGEEKWDPKSKETADHSLPYITVAALLDGDIWLDTYHEPRFRDEDLLEILQKVEVEEREEYSEMYPPYAPNKVTVELSSGETLEKEVVKHTGHPENPLSDEELEEKFHKLTGGHFSEEEREEFLEFFWNLEEQDSLDKIYDILESYR